MKLAREAVLEKIKKARQVEIPLKNIKTNIGNVAFAFGIKQRELVLALYKNMPIEQLKCKQDNDNRDEIVAIFEQNLSGLSIWRRWVMLRKLHGENAENLDECKTKDSLKKYIKEKYGAVIMKLVKDEEKKYLKIIDVLSNFKLSIEELIEKNILEEQCETMNLNLEVMKYMYMVSASEIITDDEKETMLSQVSPSEEESQCIEDVKEKMRTVNRLIQLNKVAKVLESSSKQSEKEECLRQNGVTLEEIETIMLELYDRNDLFSLEGISEKNLQRRTVIKATIKKWPYMYVEERMKVKKSEYFSDREKTNIQNISELLQHYKAVINRNNRESQKDAKVEL